MSAKLLELTRVELEKRYSFALRGMPAIRCARSRRRVTAARPGHSANRGKLV
jgi:hypothetical protein